MHKWQCPQVLSLYSWNDRTVQTAVAVALLMVGATTAVANLWGVQRINRRLLGSVGPQASELLGREVSFVLKELVI